jgi:hypothetical protein
MRLRSTLALALALLVGPATAWADATAFGKRTLDIPAPQGFVPVSREAPGYFARLPKTSDGVRLVEFYVTPEDKAAVLAGRAPALRRYFELSVRTDLDGLPLADGWMGDMREQIDAALRKNGEPAANARFWSQAARKSATPNTDWGLFFAAQPGDAHTLEAVALVAANHQQVDLGAHAHDLESGADVWAEQAVFDWALAIRAANPDDPTVVATWDDFPPGVLARALTLPLAALGVGAGLVIAVVVVLVRRRRRARSP